MAKVKYVKLQDQGQQLLYPKYCFVTRNTHVEYESPSTKHSEVNVMHYVDTCEEQFCWTAVLVTVYVGSLTAVGTVPTVHGGGTPLGIASRIQQWHSFVWAKF